MFQIWVFGNTFLVKDHWSGFITRNAHMVNTVNSVSIWVEGPICMLHIFNIWLNCRSVNAKFLSIPLKILTHTQWTSGQYQQIWNYSLWHGLDNPWWYWKLNINEGFMTKICAKYVFLWIIHCSIIYMRMHVFFIILINQ